jgi:hypothetical protein
MSPQPAFEINLNDREEPYGTTGSLSRADTSFPAKRITFLGFHQKYIWNSNLASVRSGPLRRSREHPSIQEQFSDGVRKEGEDLG